MLGLASCEQPQAGDAQPHEGGRAACMLHSSLVLPTGMPWRLVCCVTGQTLVYWLSQHQMDLATREWPCR